MPMVWFLVPLAALVGFLAGLLAPFWLVVILDSLAERSARAGPRGLRPYRAENSRGRPDD